VALLVPYDHHRASIKEGRPTDHCRIIAESTVSMHFDEVGEGKP